MLKGRRIDLPFSMTKKMLRIIFLSFVSSIGLPNGRLLPRNGRERPLQELAFGYKAHRIITPVSHKLRGFLLHYHVCLQEKYRSEERRVGKECRLRWWQENDKKIV